MLKETSWSSRSGVNNTRTTPPCYINTTLGNRLYAQRKGPMWQTQSVGPVRTVHISVQLTEHYVTQASTEQFWKYSLLTSRQSQWSTNIGCMYLYSGHMYGTPSWQVGKHSSKEVETTATKASWKITEKTNRVLTNDKSSVIHNVLGWRWILLMINLGRSDLIMLVYG